MSLSLPSLTAVRVFEVAGRLQNFSNAAVELNVTQGAVSRQIRALEDQLGVKLFVRMTRQVALTEVGRRYLCEVQAALSQIQQATLSVQGGNVRTRLLISVLPSVGSFWLMPRLARFSQRYPDIETRVISSIEPVDLHSREADIAIRVGALPGRNYATGMARVDLRMVCDWRGVLSDELMPDVLVPVFAGALDQHLSTVEKARDLLAFPLIHTASRPHAWPDWIAAHALPQISPTRNIEYGHFFMSLEAAREARGIAIIPDILLTDSTLRDLIPLTQFKVRSAGEYYVLCLAERSKEREIGLFRQWMLEQMPNAGVA